MDFSPLHSLRIRMFRSLFAGKSVFCFILSIAPVFVDRESQLVDIHLVQIQAIKAVAKAVLMASPISVREPRPS